MTESSALRDIATGEDIDELITAFYSRLLRDPIVGFIFTDIAHIDAPGHLPLHLQKIGAFWRQQLLGPQQLPPGQAGYRGQTFAVHSDIHRRVALTAEHFHRWLFLFDDSVDALFRGPLADVAKNRARSIAASMQQALAQRHHSDLELNPLIGVQQQAPESKI